jgi:hypothetical protein
MNDGEVCQASGHVPFALPVADAGPTWDASPILPYGAREDAMPPRSRMIARMLLGESSMGLAVLHLQLVVSRPALTLGQDVLPALVQVNAGVGELLLPQQHSSGVGGSAAARETAHPMPRHVSE